MKLLILGGTAFLGYHLVEAARQAGHEVTIFTRGLSHPELFADVERLIGDRDGNLDALRGRSWDAVVDTSGYVPRIVGDSAKLLSESVGFYAFVSSISVYRDLDKPDFDEESPVRTLEDETKEEVREAYGELKALCERKVEEYFPGRSLFVRPGLIVGPRDTTDRFTYWPARFSEGGSILAPGNREDQVQWIDARDLSEWIVRMIEKRATGTYNATGPESRFTRESFLEAGKAVAPEGTELVWVDPSFLIAQGVGPWIEMPLWIPDEGEEAAFCRLLSANVEKAVAAGLTFRPLAVTIRDTLAWDRSRPADLLRKAGLDRDKERLILAEWNARTQEVK